jgi:hypothetical protein
MHRPAEMTMLEAVEAEDIEAIEAVEFPQPDVNTEALQSIAELRKLVLAITLAGSYPLVHARLSRTTETIPSQVSDSTLTPYVLKRLR